MGVEGYRNGGGIELKGIYREKKGGLCMYLNPIGVRCGGSALCSTLVMVMVSLEPHQCLSKILTVFGFAPRIIVDGKVGKQSIQ